MKRRYLILLSTMIILIAVIAIYSQKDDVKENRIKTLEVKDNTNIYLPVDIENHWAYRELWDFVQADILKGYPTSNNAVVIRPDEFITRAEFVAILVRAMNLKSDEKAISFQDVQKNTWYTEPIRIVSSLGIVKGMGNNNFEPNRNIKRDEIAAIIIRAFESTISFTGEKKSFADVKNYWAKDSIEKASQIGIVKGDGNGLFHPNSNATRAEAIAMIYRSLHKEKSDLPSDEQIKSVIYQSENKFTKAYNALDIKEYKEIGDTYLTGYEKASSVTKLFFLLDLIQNNIGFKKELAEEIQVNILEKNNRFAIAEQKNAKYHIVYSKGESQDKLIINSSGKLFLKKMEDDSWKIYRILYYYTNSPKVFLRQERIPRF